MNLFKKLWNFLKEEPLVLEQTAVEKVKETVNHCTTHLRFRKNCPECLRFVALI